MTTPTLIKLLSTLDLTLATACAVIVVSKKREPAVTLAWVLCFYLIPFLGILSYMFFGFQHFRLRRRKTPDPGSRVAQIHAQALATVPPPFQSVADLAHRVTRYPVTMGNKVRIYERADDTNAALTRAIRQARHHIHMCYYIFKPDADGLFFRDLLAEQAKRGVQVRLLMDAVGSFAVDDDFLTPLREAGAQAAFFGLHSNIRRPWGFHFRNHRKLTVIDGETGFLGSQNIGRNVRWVGRRRIAWKETDARVEGPAVEELQTVFAEDWHFVTGENLGPNYFPAPQERGNTLVQVLPTGPERRDNALTLLFLEALHAARERVTLTTPYFIPTPAVALALTGAARRGVRVELLVPRRTDHPIVAWAGRSYYEELMESGVKIFEFDETFLHSKVVTIDGRLALVGSANMDTRSFQINFELSLLLYDPDAAQYLEKRFDDTLPRAHPIAPRLSPRLTPRDFIEGLCRLFSPLL